MGATQSAIIPLNTEVLVVDWKPEITFYFAVTHGMTVGYNTQSSVYSFPILKTQFLVVTWGRRMVMDSGTRQTCFCLPAI